MDQSSGLLKDTLTCLDLQKQHEYIFRYNTVENISVRIANFKNDVKQYTQ